MRMIQKFVEAIDEEIEGAKEYAEKYVEHKVSGHMADAFNVKSLTNF